jgi:hypothetical protein
MAASCVPAVRPPDLCAHLGRPGAEEEDGVLTGNEPSVPPPPGPRSHHALQHRARPGDGGGSCIVRYRRGETVAIGESGRDVPRSAGCGSFPAAGPIESGEAIFEGEDLFRLDDAGIRRIRGNRIA